MGGTEDAARRSPQLENGCVNQIDAKNAVIPAPADPRNVPMLATTWAAEAGSSITHQITSASAAHPAMVLRYSARTLARAPMALVMMTAMPGSEPDRCDGERPAPRRLPMLMRRLPPEWPSRPELTFLLPLAHGNWRRWFPPAIHWRHAVRGHLRPACRPRRTSLWPCCLACTR